MIAIYKSIIDDLLNYLIEGNHEGGTALNFNGTSFDSTTINNLKYQFIRKYEQVDSITDKNIIPVLIITQPDQYLKGRILYKGNFIDLKSILINENDSTGLPIKKINFYIIPQLVGVNGNNLGSIVYDLKIDYMADFDTYGFMSKEIDSIVKQHYFKKHRGDYYNIITPTSNLFYVPTNERFLNQGSLLNRIAQTFNIRFCSLV